jgi:signal peptidase II
MTGDRSLPVVRRQVVRAAVVAAAVIGFDQLTKQWAVGSLTEGGTPKHVLGWLQFNLHFNSGMAFSRGTGLGRVIGLLAVVVSVVLFSTLRRHRGAAAVVAIGLISGGAVGNVLDRLFRSKTGFLNGAVVDFIDLQHWPIFNIADSAVVVGAGLLMIDSWRQDRARARAAAVVSSDTPTTETRSTDALSKDSDSIS